MGSIGILREHLPTEPRQQVGGINFCGAADSQPRSHGTPLQWTKRSAHLLLQMRVKTLNHELGATRYN
jgi:hypothetical protein